jgi:hypothetical protein
LARGVEGTNPDTMIVFLNNDVRVTTNNELAIILETAAKNREDACFSIEEGITRQNSVHLKLHNVETTNCRSVFRIDSTTTKLESKFGWMISSSVGITSGDISKYTQEDYRILFVNEKSDNQKHEVAETVLVKS